MHLDLVWYDSRDQASGSEVGNHNLDLDLDAKFSRHPHAVTEAKWFSRPLGLTLALLPLVRHWSIFTVMDTVSTEKYLRVASLSIALYDLACILFILIRTFNITRRNRQMGTILLVSFVVATGLEWFTNFYDRVPVVLNGNCTPGNPDETAWTYYVVVMVYDLGTLVVSTFYLVRHNVNGKFSRLIKTMIYDGLGYFVALTGKILPCVFPSYYTAQVMKVSKASCGYAVTWIMSQRILIHLREMTPESEGHFDNVVITRQLHPGRDVATAIRSQFESQKATVDADLGSDSPAARSTDDMELDVRVHVERSVTVDYLGDRERFGKPRGQWEKHPHSGV
ncbi:hypothetical protein PAXINDRAFT_158551 [Paxillus involutus ATCC 200175]|uniref:Uncharacterized protein n=1 Tax=Paxillus involutus ATCC 200175 TaxID=664439 RepID=A0A0C9TG53_PAXIN|nr:hypothetical protein PAXINDRAFT_158551 [Paxillus involutus ATCC 200175]